MFRSLLSALFGSEDEEEQETFTYECRECRHVFTSTARHVTDESCPECGARDIRPDIEL